MTVFSNKPYKFFEIQQETFFWFKRELSSSSVNELTFDITNITERDRVDELVVTLELDNFLRVIKDSKDAEYWNSKQPFVETSVYDKLKLVVCLGRADWLGKFKEKKSIDFNTKDKTVFMCWIVDDISIINSIKANLRYHSVLNLYVVLNEGDEFFKNSDGLSILNPKLRSFSLTFE